MFHEFDIDGSGSISVDEAKHMLRKLDIPDEEVKHKQIANEIYNK